jgi:ribosomal protein S12 methylthiotransferase accessory factor
MEINVQLLEGQQLQASFGKHTVISDQSVSAGGKEEYPEPFDYFLASLSLCAGFYVRKFCEQRGISTEGISITQTNSNIDENNHYKKRIALTINLPATFPDKYKKAIINAANTCTVKKVIQAMPEFSVDIAQQVNN